MTPALPLHALDAVLEHERITTLLDALSAAVQNAFAAEGLELRLGANSVLVEPSRHTRIRWWQVPGHTAGEGELIVELATSVDERGSLLQQLLMYGRAPDAKTSHGLLEVTLGHVTAPAGWTLSQGPGAVLTAFEDSALGRREDWSDAARVLVDMASTALAP